MNRKTILLLIAIALVMGCTSQQTESQWVDLFDGKTLNGWQNPYEWGEVTVDQDSAEIVLLADKKFFLVTEKEYSNFVFQADIKMPEGKSNSGFMFRAHVDTNRVFGYQAEVDPSNRKWFGGLYDEGRRMWLNPVRGDSVSVAAFRTQAGEAFKRYDWNTYQIRCNGDTLQIWVNDVLTTDYIDTVDAKGYIGLQHHGEAGKKYRFKNIRIKEL